MVGCYADIGMTKNIRDYKVFNLDNSNSRLNMGEYYR